MSKTQKSKQYDLEDRTLKYSKDIIAFVKSLHNNLVSKELARQLVRSSTSVGANYIEANEALSKKDVAMRIKICRKEAKESAYWLKLVEVNSGGDTTRETLIDEATQLTKIFSAIVEKSKSK